MEEESQDNNWPLPKFYFSVDLGGDMTNIPFQEVSGLDAESQPIEYRHGDSPIFSNINMPGVVKYGNVTMKRGIFTNNNHFFQWYTEIKMNTIRRQNVVIKLLDENGSPTMKWTLLNAWPTKITGTDMKSDGNDVAIETLELAHEGLTIGNA